MNYEKIILEMLERIKDLEEKVERLETKKENVEKKSSVNFTNEVREYIKSKKIEARKKGEREIILLCNDIQKEFKVTGRPRSVCVAMYDCMQANDEVLFAPPKKYSTTVKIKYYL